MHLSYVENVLKKRGYQLSPNKTFRPPSTPEKPMKAKLSKPAVTSTIDIPRIPLGMLTKANCSRIPAKTVKAKAKQHT